MLVQCSTSVCVGPISLRVGKRTRELQNNVSGVPSRPSVRPYATSFVLLYYTRTMYLGAHTRVPITRVSGQHTYANEYIHGHIYECVERPWRYFLQLTSINLTTKHVHFMRLFYKCMFVYIPTHSPCTLDGTAVEYHYWRLFQTVARGGNSSNDYIPRQRTVVEASSDSCPTDRDTIAISTPRDWKLRIKTQYAVSGKLTSSADIVDILL